MRRFLTYSLRIRRVEFFVAEIPIPLLPVVLIAETTAPLRSAVFWEGIVLFFLLFNFGDMINCLADRDLDAKYKKHLSEAVYGLGVGVVRAQIGLTVLASLAITGHLAWALDRWSLVPLVVVGILLGAGYSVPPVRLKGRGALHPVTQWTIIFMIPMVLMALIVTPHPPALVLAFCAAYGVLQCGVILINTAEDYPEDRAEGIRTPTVTFGLRPSIALAFVLILAGGTGALGALGAIALERSAPLAALLAFAPLAITIAVSLTVTARLWRAIARGDLDESMVGVRRSAKQVPFWITLNAWGSLAAAATLLWTR